MVSVILLAAGQSKRMGDKNKLTKEIRGIPLIKHTVKNILSSSIHELIIILGYQKEIIEKLIVKNKKIKFIFNKDFESGMASSIKTGLNNLSNETESFFISLADMPLVSYKIYDHLIKSKGQKEIIIPTYKGLNGNPILFSKSMKNKIMSIQGDVGAKSIFEYYKDKILKIETGDSNVTRDFNTEENFNF